MAKLKGNVAVYRERIPDGDPGDKWCEITFTFENEHTVRVRAKNAEHYGGMGVYFNGLYYKICGPLIKEDSISLDERYGVQVPVFCTFESSASTDSAEIKDAKNELIALLEPLT